MKKIKVIVLDFDGTLTKGGNCWRYIWEDIDDVDTDMLYYNMRMNNEIDDEKWNDLVTKRYGEKNVTKDICINASKKIVLQNGISELIKELYENNIKIFILSGGIHCMIEKALGDLSNYIESIEARDFIYDKKGIVCKFGEYEHNHDDKSEFLNLLKSRYNLEGDDILFVGNDYNDEKAYESGARTLCINPNKTDYTNKKIWHNHIKECNDIREILTFCGL